MLNQHGTCCSQTTVVSLSYNTAIFTCKYELVLAKSHGCIGLYGACLFPRYLWTPPGIKLCPENSSVPRGGLDPSKYKQFWSFLYDQPSDNSVALGKEVESCIQFEDLILSLYCGGIEWVDNCHVQLMQMVTGFQDIKGRIKVHSICYWTLFSHLFYIHFNPTFFLFLHFSIMITFFLYFITLMTLDEENNSIGERLLLILNGQSTGTPQNWNSPSPHLGQEPTLHSPKFSWKPPGLVP